jgi:phosphohistidine swiveling domain-containing protein
MAKYSLLNHDIDTSFLNIETTWAGMRSPLLKKQVNYFVPDSLCEIINGSTINYFQNERQAKIFSRSCARNILERPGLLSAIKKKTSLLTVAVLRLASANFPLKNLSDSKMIAFLEDSRKLQMEMAAWGMVIAFADVYGVISNQVVGILSKRKGLRYPYNVYMDNLTSPSAPSLTEQAYKKISHSINDEYLQKKYFWLDQGYIGRGLSRSEIRNIRRHHKNTGDSVKIRKSILLKELALSPNEKNIFKVSSDLVFLKSLRADSRQAIYVVVNHIVDLLAKHWRIPASHLETLSTEELISAIKSSYIDVGVLADRWRHSLAIPESIDKYKIISGSEVEKILSGYTGEKNKKISNSGEMKGQIAQSGKVRGMVRLVFGSQHNSRVKKGDILVSISTSPQLLPAMKLAAAFVTDVGGITSHAAIVARELKKPCIVGTRNATQILKDGDLVEVDADKGVVKIIKRENQEQKRDKKTKVKFHA